MNAIAATASVPAGLEVAAVTEIYNDDVVRKFTVMTVFWGIIGMTVGAFIAAELGVSVEELAAEAQETADRAMAIWRAGR